VERNNLVLERFREREEKTTGLETQRLANLQILNRTDIVIISGEAGEKGLHLTRNPGNGRSLPHTRTHKTPSPTKKTTALIVRPATN